MSDESMTLIEHLVDGAYSLGLDDVPANVQDQAVLCLVDTVGCIIAGTQVSETLSLLEAEYLVRGSLEDWPDDVVARVLGYLGDALELNDLTGGHSSIGIVTAILVHAIASPIGGRDILKAIIVGTETTAKLYQSTVGRSRPFSESGMVVPTLYNAIGAAAALSLLQDLTQEQAVNALAVAGTLTSWGPAEVIFGDGGTVKPLLFGSIPAAAALQAVRYARAGVTGPTKLLESPLGLLRAISENYRVDVIENPQVWHSLKPHRKVHAACGYTHSSIDAASMLALSADQIDQIESVQLKIPKMILEAVGKMTPPVTSNDARFHLSYLVTLTLHGHYPIVPAHTINFESYIAQESVKSLMRKIRILPVTSREYGSSKPYNQSMVTVYFQDGRSQKVSCEYPKGSTENPLSKDEVIDKFHRLVAPVFGVEQSSVFVNQLLTIGEVLNSREVFSPILSETLAKVGA